MAVSIFSQSYVLGRIVVPGSAAATAANLAQSGGLFRLGIALDVVTFVSDVVIAWAFYGLLRSVDRRSGAARRLAAHCGRSDPGGDDGERPGHPALAERCGLPAGVQQRAAAGPGTPLHWDPRPRFRGRVRVPRSGLGGARVRAVPLALRAARPGRLGHRRLTAPGRWDRWPRCCRRGSRPTSASCTCCRCSSTRCRSAPGSCCGASACRRSRPSPAR